jgi:hypothetical protein
MNRADRRKADSIKRKVNSLSPGARELAIKTGMELHDSYAEANEKRREERIKQEFELIRQEYAGKVEARAKKMVAEMDLGKQAKEQAEVIETWRRAYLQTFLDWYSAGGSPRPQELDAADLITNASDDFQDHLVVIDNRVGKEARHFEQVELLYGALRWLATTYWKSKSGAESCPDLNASCRRACGFRYVAHQSDVTMGKYGSDYEVTWKGKVVKLKEHLGFGTGFDPRRTVRIAFFYDKPSRRVVVGYVGQHQSTDVSN